MFVFFHPFHTQALDQMNPPPRTEYPMHPCVNCGKIYVGKDQMGTIMCMNTDAATCSRGHVWCRGCWEKKYSENWRQFCPLKMKKQEYKERRFDF